MTDERILRLNELAKKYKSDVPLTEEEMAELEEGLFKKFGEVMHAKAEELGCNCGKEEPAPAATAAPKQETSTAADELKEAGKDILDDVVKSIGEPSK